MKDKRESGEGTSKEKIRYMNQFDPSKLIQIALCPVVKGIIPSDNQRVNDFKDLAQLDGIKFAYDLCAEEIQTGG